MDRIPACRSLSLALAATLLTAAPALAGPPWVSVEYPANPFDRATRDALVVVHTYHHGEVMPYPVAAYAEGIRGGARQRVSLDVGAASRTGVWAVRGSLPDDGPWVVVATMTAGPDSKATALVGIHDGTLASVRVPHEIREGWIVPHEATRADVDAALGALGGDVAAPAQPAPRRGSVPWPAAAALALIALWPAVRSRS